MTEILPLGVTKSTTLFQPQIKGEHYWVEQTKKKFNTNKDRREATLPEGPINEQWVGVTSKLLNDNFLLYSTFRTQDDIALISKHFTTYTTRQVTELEINLENITPNTQATLVSQILQPKIIQDIIKGLKSQKETQHIKDTIKYLNTRDYSSLVTIQHNNQYAIFHTIPHLNKLILLHSGFIEIAEAVKHTMPNINNIVVGTHNTHLKTNPNEGIINHYKQLITKYKVYVTNKEKQSKSLLLQSTNQSIKLEPIDDTEALLTQCKQYTKAAYGNEASSLLLLLQYIEQFTVAKWETEQHLAIVIMEDRFCIAIFLKTPQGNSDYVIQELLKNNIGYSSGKEVSVNELQTSISKPKGQSGYFDFEYTTESTNLEGKQGKNLRKIKNRFDKMPKFTFTTYKLEDTPEQVASDILQLKSQWTKEWNDRHKNKNNPDGIINQVDLSYSVVDKIFNLKTNLQKASNTYINVAKVDDNLYGFSVIEMITDTYASAVEGCTLLSAPDSLQQYFHIREIELCKNTLKPNFLMYGGGTILKGLCKFKLKLKPSRIIKVLVVTKASADKRYQPAAVAKNNKS